METDYRRLALEAIERAMAKTGLDRQALIEEALRLNRLARAAESGQADPPRTPGDPEKPSP